MKVSILEHGTWHGMLLEKMLAECAGYRSRAAKNYTDAAEILLNERDMMLAAGAPMPPENCNEPWPWPGRTRSDRRAAQAVGAFDHGYRLLCLPVNVAAALTAAQLGSVQRVLRTLKQRGDIIDYAPPRAVRWKLVQRRKRA